MTFPIKTLIASAILYCWTMTADGAQPKAAVSVNPPLAVTVDHIAVIDATGTKNGRYIFVLDVLNGKVVIRQVTNVVMVNPDAAPTPPPTPPGPGPDPEPPPVGLAKDIAKEVAKVEDPDKTATAHGLAKAYEGISDMITAGQLKTPERAIQATNILSNGFLASKGKVGAWHGFVEYILGIMKGQTIQGVQTILDTAAVVLRKQ